MKTISRPFTTLVLCLTLLAAARGSADAGERVGFASASAPSSAAASGKAGQEGLETGRPAGQTLTGILSRPSGAGPFPAVVLLHGCAGIWAWNRVWTERLLEWGYVVLDVDSLTPRGRKNVCRRVFAVAPAVRALDAFGAKRFLGTLDFVHRERVAVMGMSHGAWAALIAAREETAAKLAAEPFRAAVALYPWCEGAHALATPLLILIGERDDWTPAKRCRKQVADLDPGSGVVLKVYPGAHHGFDFEGLDEEQDGHVIRHHTEAASDAIATARQFLADWLASRAD